MKRRKFIHTCSISAAGVSTLCLLMQSCGSVHYVAGIPEENGIVIPSSEFWIDMDKTKLRKYVFIKTGEGDFPLCLYHQGGDEYIAVLLKCTHQGCELNVGAGRYTCPCHGSEFSMAGKLMQGPAERDLQTFNTDSDEEYIRILWS